MGRSGMRSCRRRRRGCRKKASCSCWHPLVCLDEAVECPDKSLCVVAGHLHSGWMGVWTQWLDLAQIASADTWHKHCPCSDSLFFPKGLSLIFVELMRGNDFTCNLGNTTLGHILVSTAKTSGHHCAIKRSAAALPVRPYGADSAAMRALNDANSPEYHAWRIGKASTNPSRFERHSFQLSATGNARFGACSSSS